ncbi:MAG: ABC transporter ATP-binding protein, partial [Finegoldia magna]|nr:ABC transporter ATP-binding protein [Finegoldia magna]
KDAPIVILDEATSYIYPENEALLQNALANLVKGKTLIIIAHRLKTIVNADEIFVIKDGKLDSQGKHGELLNSSLIYKNMYEANLRGDN